MMDILRCLLLPIHGKTLIVPYSAVAEVIPFEEIGDITKGSDWVLGEFNWRGIKVPVISLEMQDDSKDPWMSSKALRVAILNRCVDDQGPSFIGLVLQGLPSMSRFKRSDIHYAAPTDKPYLSMEVTVRGKRAFIPNLAWIQHNTNTVP